MLVPPEPHGNEPAPGSSVPFGHSAGTSANPGLDVFHSLIAVEHG